MFTITITHVPSDRFGDDTPVELPEARLFGGFRPYSGRRAASLYGAGAKQVTYENATRRAATWATREAADRNAAHLTARGYTVRVTEA